jgi:excisionase family DNA binding protein
MTQRGGAFMSRGEVAEALGVSRTTVNRLIGARAIPVVQFRGCARVPRAALEAWLAEQARAAVAAVHEMQHGAGAEVR